MKIIDKSVEIMKTGSICDHCLGRQFAQLLKGTTNEWRGRAIRTVVAMAADSGENAVDGKNFAGLAFRNIDTRQKREKCRICGNFFDNNEKYAELAVKKLRSVECKTFLIGTRVPAEIATNEELLWEEFGTEFCEPIKAEMNREVGKIVEKASGKRAEFRSPDVTIILDPANKRADIQIASLWFYGEYQKLVRGIPQTKWPCRNCGGRGCKRCHGRGRMYRTSVEEIIAKPFLKACGSKASSFHGAGREDIDARCLGWRPFVLEILSPAKRTVDLKKLTKDVNKSGKVKVRNFKPAQKSTASMLKAARPEKTYRALVVFGRPASDSDMKKLSKIRHIRQQTPNRVLHRRADRVRRRGVKSVKWKRIDKRTFELRIRGEAGLYIKELIHGDKGRTTPSVAELLDNPATVKELDVVEIQKIKSRV